MFYAVDSIDGVENHEQDKTPPRDELTIHHFVEATISVLDSQHNIQSHSRFCASILTWSD